MIVTAFLVFMTFFTSLLVIAAIVKFNHQSKAQVVVWVPVCIFSWITTFAHLWR